MATLDPNNMSQILTLIGITLAADLTMSDFVDFGQMTSHIYRARFYRICQELVRTGKMQASTIAHIIYFATLIKSKKRIEDSLTNMSGKYGNSQWFKETIMFFKTQTVQYVSEAEKSGKFPVVNITTCQPNLCCHFLKLHLLNDGIARTDEELWKKFSENLFVVQMRITPQVQQELYNWEVNFWNNKVTSSKNPDAARYKAGFNQAFWETKAADNYKWIVNGNETDDTLDKAAIITWLKTA